MLVLSMIALSRKKNRKRTPRAQRQCSGGPRDRIVALPHLEGRSGSGEGGHFDKWRVWKGASAKECDDELAGEAQRKYLDRLDSDFWLDSVLG